MKNIIKTIIIAAVALTLAGCAENNESEFDASEVISNAIEAATSETVDETNSSNDVEETTNSSTPATVESKPTETNNSKPTENKPAVSTTTTTNTTKPVESKPTESKPTESKPVVKPVESKPAVSSSTTTTTTPKPVESKPTESKPVVKPTESKPVEKPVETKPIHNCDIDGHIWENYTDTTTKTVDIFETHEVVANGYDLTLAGKYFGTSAVYVDFTPYFGTNAYGYASTPVKTTGIKTTTKYSHKCTECGFSEVYKTEKTTTPSDKWEFEYPEDRGVFTVLWYDINNIPAEVYEAVEKDNKAFEEWKNSLH